MRLYCLPICGRYRLTRPDKPTEHFDIEPDDDWAPRFNIAPAQNIPVIRQHAEEPKRFGSGMRWGLIPFWAKDAQLRDAEPPQRWLPPTHKVPIAAARVVADGIGRGSMDCACVVEVMVK